MHTLERKPPLITPTPAAEAFYCEVLQLMAKSGIPFLVSGTYALASYTGIDRPTKDVDVFAKAGDALKMLHYFKEHGFDVEIVDERWLNRVTRGELFVDIITNMPTVTTHVTDDWFVGAPETELFGARVKLVPPTQFIWSKIFVQDHHRYDMADVAHMILKCHEAIDWKQLLSHMELYWEVLLIALLNFRFVYPSERATSRAGCWTNCSSGCATRPTSKDRANACAGAGSSARAIIRSTSRSGDSPRPSAISKNNMANDRCG